MMIGRVSARRRAGRWNITTGGGLLLFLTFLGLRVGLRARRAGAERKEASERLAEARAQGQRARPWEDRAAEALEAEVSDPGRADGYGRRVLAKLLPSAVYLGTRASAESSGGRARAKLQISWSPPGEEAARYVVDVTWDATPNGAGGIEIAHYNPVLPLDDRGKVEAERMLNEELWPVAMAGAVR